MAKYSNLYDVLTPDWRDYGQPPEPWTAVKVDTFRDYSKFDFLDVLDPDIIINGMPRIDMIEDGFGF